MVMRTINGVEIDLDDIEDDDIESEFLKRDLDCDCEECEECPEVSHDYDEQIREMFVAFKLGKNDKAMEIAKSMAQELTGGIL